MLLTEVSRIFPAQRHGGGTTQVESLNIGGGGGGGGTTQVELFSSGHDRKW